MRLPLQIVLWLLALLFLVMGVGFLIDPVSAAGDMGLEPMTIAGMNTLRGDFAGLFLAMTAMLALGLLRREPVWLLATAVLLGTIALGRLLGFALDGTAQQPLIAFAVEVVSVLLLLIAARQLTPPHA